MLFLDFFAEKGENGRKNRRNFGEFMLFFAFSLSSLGFLAYFLGVFLLVFFDFREKRVLSGVFLRLFLFFWRNYRLFICSFSSSVFDFLQSNKKTAIFMQNNDEKQNIWKNVPVFPFSVFCSGYFYMNFCVFCENRV